MYFCMRIKIIKVNYWPKIAFWPLKWHFFILEFSRSSCKKGRRKAQKRPMTLIFWQKMPNSILLKVRKNEQVILITFWAIKKTERWWWNPPLPPIPVGLKITIFSIHDNDYSYLEVFSIPLSSNFIVWFFMTPLRISIINRPFTVAL